MRSVDLQGLNNILTSIFLSLVKFVKTFFKIVSLFNNKCWLGSGRTEGGCMYLTVRIKHRECLVDVIV